MDKPKDIPTSRIQREELSQLMKLVNLIPKNSEGSLPENLLDPTKPIKDFELLAAINRLPEPLRSFLLNEFEQESTWCDPDEYSQIVRRDEVTGPGRTLLGRSRVIDSYNEIRHWRRALRTILNEGVIIGGSQIAVNETHVAYVMPDRFGRAIHGTDVRDIRVCPICGDFFLARRADSVVCDPNGKCAKTYAKRKERENARVREQLAAAKKGSKKKTTRKPKRTDSARKR